MTDETRSPVLSRPAAAAAVSEIGWRYLLGTLCTRVEVASMEDGLSVARTAVDAAGAGASEHLRIDVRPDRVELGLQTQAVAGVTTHDADLARAITVALVERGRPPVPGTTDRTGRSVQMLEIGIDALDIASIRPFWRAVMGYEAEPGRDGPEDGLVDPYWQGPAIWFQQLDAPRPQRNRIHFDITVPHDEAPARIAAALAAGGHLVSDAEARAFWILADAEGNEICVCTWQDRD